MYPNQYNRAQQGQNLISPFWGCQHTSSTGSTDAGIAQRSYGMIYDIDTIHLSHLLRKSVQKRGRYRAFTGPWAGRRTTRLVLHIGWMDSYNIWIQNTSMVFDPNLVLTLAIYAVLIERCPVAFFALFHPFSSPAPASFIPCSHTSFTGGSKTLWHVFNFISLLSILISIKSGYWLQIAPFPCKYPLYAVCLYSYDPPGILSGVIHYITLYQLLKTFI